MIEFNVVEFTPVKVEKAALQLFAVDKACVIGVVLVENLGDGLLIPRAHLALFGYLSRDSFVAAELFRTSVVAGHKKIMNRPLFVRKLFLSAHKSCQGIEFVDSLDRQRRFVLQGLFDPATVFHFKYVWLSLDRVKFPEKDKSHVGNSLMRSKRSVKQQNVNQEQLFKSVAW